MYKLYITSGKLGGGGEEEIKLWASEIEYTKNLDSFKFCLCLSCHLPKRSLSPSLGVLKKMFLKHSDITEIII